MKYASYNPVICFGVKFWEGCKTANDVGDDMNSNSFMKSDIEKEYKRGFRHLFWYFNWFMKSNIPT